MSNTVDLTLGEFARYLEVVIKTLREGCQNPNCPNGHKIEVAIFKGTGYCSDNCRKALGLDPQPIRSF